MSRMESTHYSNVFHHYFSITRSVPVQNVLVQNRLIAWLQAATSTHRQLHTVDILINIMKSNQLQQLGWARRRHMHTHTQMVLNYRVPHLCLIWGQENVLFNSTKMPYVSRQRSTRGQVLCPSLFPLQQCPPPVKTVFTYQWNKLGYYQHRKPVQTNRIPLCVNSQLLHHFHTHTSPYSSSKSHA